MSKTLRIGNLPAATTEQDLVAKFGQFGSVLSASVVRDESTGRSKRFGFVEMASDDEAIAAINRLNMTQYGDYTMSVSALRAPR